MKKLLLLLTLLAGSLFAGAQRVYFIYLQTENGAPFYVRIGENVHSSTGAGYAIVSNLKDSSYMLQVGFPGQTAESRFSIALNKGDHGFVLKQVNGAWTLFDLQELTLIKALAATGPTDAENEALLAAADPFTRLLVQASDDMSLLQSGPSAPPANLAVVNSDTVILLAAAERQPAALMPEPVKVAVERKDTVTPPAEPVFARSVVSRRSESSTTEGFGLVFLDKQGDATDTIRLLIPNPKEILAKAVLPEPIPAVIIEEKKDSVRAKSDNLVQPVLRTEAAAPVADTAAQAAAPVPALPAECKAVAEEKDFLKLRKSMASAADEGEMVVVARKGFKTRCFTTEQVRHLSALFLTALGKFNFLEAAHGHVSDPAQFASLGSELKDGYFNQRFQELTK